MAGEQFYTSRYAMIRDGIVENIALFDSAVTANSHAEQLRYDCAVCTDLYFVTIGDTYVDGVFFHEGDEIERRLSLEETVSVQTQQISDLELLVLQLGGVI